MSEAINKELAVREPEPPAVADDSAAREREALVDEIVRELRKDSLKEAAQAKLKQTSIAKSIGKFLQHPAALLILGFTLTGYIGLKLQQGEWERQQMRLVEIREVELKYTIMDDVIKAVGARNATATAIIEPSLRRTGGAHLRAEEIERFKEWKKAAYDWRFNTQVLRSKLDSHIKTQAAAQQFEEITTSGKNINANMLKIEDYLRERNWVGDDTSDKMIDDVIIEIDKTNKHVKQLTEAIIAEAGKSITSEKR